MDIAFDGCDEVDENLHALKSCGGIHTKEKIVSAMAKEYVLLTDETKYFDSLPFGYPLTIEVVRSARAFVEKLNAALNNMPGIVEHSLFCGVATKAIVTNQDGFKIVDRSSKK